ncbi:MAG TPA: hypothetical protein VFD02_07530 [Syntrophomonadaceae bacterium]|nr:hypothetical protein [Syntrophomonadaceae bacterium]
MLLRNIRNIPVLKEDNAEIIGLVDKVVIGDNYKIAYLVIFLNDERKKMIDPSDFNLTSNAVIIQDENRIKSYLHGEELSIYDKKLGDLVFDHSGNELGIVTDFVLNPENKEVVAIELSAGILQDLWVARKHVNLSDITWKSESAGVMQRKGIDVNGSQ